jgi:hypothetical protein
VRPQTDDEGRLIRAILSFADDPIGFVLFALPWGKKGTELEREDGPDVWQSTVLKLLGAALRREGVFAKLTMTAVRLAVASGHGIGKTALVSWIILWFISTRPNPQIVVTANTGNQLKTKTWRELAKWHLLLVNKHWFTWSATQFKMADRPETWFATAVPWSEHNSSAFAGTHAAHVLMIFDEASEIADAIWEVAEGALSTGALDGNTTIWLAFGNPTLNTGRFRQCWTKFRKRWLTFKVDSRTAKKADKNWIKELIEDWGEDSDFVRVRVRGEFPRTGPKQFIGNDIVEGAVERWKKLEDRFIPASTPKLMGVDVARQGSGQTVIVKRRGRKMHKDVTRLRIPDLMQVAARVAHEINEWQPDIVFIDAVGMGAGVFDRLIQLGYTNVIAVYSGMQDIVAQPDVHYNVRIEMWDRMKEWLKVGAIPDDKELYEDLIGPELLYDQKMKMRLERKEDMQKRGLPSPDTADALALTFAQPVPLRRDDLEATGSQMTEPEVA